MSALCRAYDTAAAAERTVDTLLRAGVSADDVQLLMGAEIHDARTEPAGSYAGRLEVHARVGRFAGHGHRRDAAQGNFADDGGSRPEGLYSNADRDVVVTYADGREHSRVAGHHALKRLLVDAGLDETSAESDIRSLHAGRVLVLLTSAALSPARAAELIDAAAN